jgi:acyl-CoA thioesterase FadM
MTGARGTMDQRILRRDADGREQVLCTARVTVACLTREGRPTRIPAAARAAFPPRA